MHKFLINKSLHLFNDVAHIAYTINIILKLDMVYCKKKIFENFICRFSPFLRNSLNYFAPIEL